MDVPDRIGELLPGILPRKAVEELLVVVDVARDDVEVQPLRRLRLAVHEQRQRFRRGIAQPFVDGQAVALRLRNLLALVVEEQFVVEAFRRRAAERRADLAGQLDRVDQILAGHFIIDAEREPAHCPVRLPLQLAMAAGDGNGDAFLRLRIVIGDRAGLARRARRSAPAAPRRCADRSAGTANRSPRAPRAGVGSMIAITASKRSSMRSSAASNCPNCNNRSNSRTRSRNRRCRERHAAAHCCAHRTTDIRSKTDPEYARQRLAEMRRQHLLVRHVVRHLAQPVHVIGKRQQPRLDLVLRQHAEGMAHHGGARDLAERADMRQAGRTVAGLEQHLVLRTFLQPRDNRFRLLERPGVGLFGERTQIARAGSKVDDGHF